MKTLNQSHIRISFIRHFVPAKRSYMATITYMKQGKQKQ